MPLNKEIRILYVEDVPADVVVINHELRKAGFNLRTKRVETKQEFQFQLEHHKPDLIISDHGLPHFDGFAALALAKERCPDVPFIFVTGSRGEEVAIKTFERGATDYVLKSNLGQLVPAVRRAMREAVERTQLRQQEIALRESEERFRMLVDGVKDYAIFMLDKKGRIASWNSGGQGIHRYCAEEVLGQHIRLFYTPEAVKRGQPALDLEAATTVGRFETEGVRVGKNGHRFDAHVVITALRDNGGGLRGFVHVTRDVTERKRAEASLRESELLKSAILETALDAIISIDQLGRVQEWNPAAEQMFGYKRADALGRLVDDLVVPPSMREIYHEGLAHYLITGVGSLLGRPIELTLCRQDGSQFSAELAISRVATEEPPRCTAIIRDITKRKRAELELETSHAQFSGIIGSAMDAIISVDANQTIQLFNAAAEVMFRCSATEAIGKPLETFIAPRHREAHRQHLREFGKSGTTSRAMGHLSPLSGLRTTGEEFPIEASMSQIEVAGRKICTVILRDITEREKAEAALREGEERYRALVESVKDHVIYLLDPLGCVASWGAGAERIEGYKAEEIIGKPLSTFFTTEDQQAGRPEQILKKATEEGRCAYEGWRVRKGGSRFWSEGSITAVRDAAGRLVGFSKIGRDMTEQKKAEEGLRRLAAIIESSDDAIFSKSLDGVIASWNPGAARLFGYSLAEAIGQPVLMLMPPDRVNEESQIIAQIKQGQTVPYFETVRRRKDGRLVDVSVTISPIRDASGKVIGASQIARDITDRKRVEERIHKLNQELEHRVRERTGQLEASNRELEAFSYSVSHDLRSPLRHILGYVDILRSEAAARLDEHSQHTLHTITESAKQMSQLIDALLSFSRMGRAEMRFVRVNLAVLLDEARHELQNDVKNRTVIWQIGKLPEVHADPVMLRQVFVNLLSNALKYTRPRDRAIVEIRSRVEGGEFICFVRDNGVGFPMEYADKLFGVFQRLHAASEFEGTGIGLANVRRIIHRHGGRTWAEGVVNAGATFYFSLPRNEKGQTP